MGEEPAAREVVGVGLRYGWGFLYFPPVFLPSVGLVHLSVAIMPGPDDL